MEHLKIYILSLLLLESLDTIEEKGLFKHKLKMRGNQLKSEIEKFDKNIFNHTEDFDTVSVLSKKIDELLENTL